MAFAFRSQPLKAFYLTCIWTSLLLVRLPFWTLYYAVPTTRSRPTWSLGRSIIVQIYCACIESMWTMSPIVPHSPADVQAFGTAEADGPV
jgi:hypothetical protein